jgi:hypothetical protein
MKWFLCLELFFVLFSPSVASGSMVSSGNKWFQPPPDHSCRGSNRDPPYQVHQVQHMFGTLCPHVRREHESLEETFRCAKTTHEQRKGIG